MTKTIANNFSQFEDGHQSLHVRGLASGIYVLIFTQANGDVYTGKFIKQ